MNNMSLGDITKASVADVAKFIKEHNAFFWGIDREQTKEINKYAQAMKLLGYQEGLKKGKSIGSHKTYNHFLKQEHWENKIPYEDVKHGHWIFVEDMVSYIKCSECGDDICWVNTKRPKYCPSCGARMDGEA